MKQSLGFYRVEYLDNKVVQVKELISQEDYNRYKELNQLKSELQVKLKGGKKGKNNDPILIQQLKDVQTELKEYSKPYFVVGSPMYDGIETGFLKIDPPSGNAGISPIRLTKVDCSDITFDDTEIED